MIIGIPRETRPDESRVAATPEVAKKLIKKGFRVVVETHAGEKAGFSDAEFTREGAQIAKGSEAFKADVVFKVCRPTDAEILLMQSGSLLVAFLEPYNQNGFFQKLAEMKINSMAMELIPRTSRAQSMDALSSQANIAGYRAVIEAASHYGRFIPMMMTAAGSAKPARVAVLGVGVAGLQAISTAKRMGAIVEAYDIRPEVREQIISVGAKVIDVNVGEEGSGSGGYARELSDEAKKRQQQLLTEKLKKFDIIITTANIPGRRSPTLINEEAVKGMRSGSVIVDMAAANGGNCPLSEPDKIVTKEGVVIIGITNYPSLVPSDASGFYGRNLLNLISIMTDEKKPGMTIPLEDDIVAACLTTYNGEMRFGK